MSKSKTRKTSANKKGPTAPKEKQLSAKQQNRQRINEQAAQLQGALMNLRQMYDQAMAEAQGLRSLLAQRDQMLTALAAQALDVSDGLFVPETYYALIRESYQGYEIDVNGGFIYITAIEVDQEDEDAISEPDAE